MFLVCGAALLAITYLLVQGATFGPLPNAPTPLVSGNLAPAIGAERHAVLTALVLRSGIALAIMAVVSTCLGWFVAGRVLTPLRLSAEAQQRFVANASHELRTPLAMMRTSLDVADAKPTPISQDAAVLSGKVREGLDQADRLVESFLMLARAEGEAMTDLERVSLPGLVQAALAARRDAIDELDLDVRLQLGNAPVTGNETLLRRLAANLVDNGVRHNRPSGFIAITTELDGATACLVVENSGQVIAHDQLAELAEPFRRGAADRTQSSNGVGMGLPIVVAIAAAHKGTLELRSRPEGGLTAVVELPGADRPSSASVTA